MKFPSSRSSNEMSDLLFVKRRGNADLHYCVPQRYEWAITNSHRRHFRTPKHTKTSPPQQEWSLGPWQHVKLRPAATRNPLPQRKSLSKPHGSGSPFCSIVAVNAGLNCNVKLESRPHAYAPTPSSRAHKQGAELNSRQKAIIKARSAMVFPVVAFSKNGEWVPEALGRKAHARLTANCTGGWSKRSVSTLQYGTHTARETGHLPFEKDDLKETEHFRLDRPHLHSSAFLLHELHAAKDQLKNAHASIERAAAFLEQGRQGPAINGSHCIRSVNAVSLPSERTEARSQALVKHINENRFSVRSSCNARKKKKKT
ncbi:hypothetical protein L7F22_045744 [Adiantum nelumboides]|nr:hypothetical protein [Adiantum nelumboides]